MKSQYLSEYFFDHLVIIGRDRLDELSQKFSNQGFQLTPTAHHNLGSSNRLIMLDSSYIELLGWEKSEMPKRAEIANQQIGLNAIVFRTNNAEECYEKLRQQGFQVNPVQDLSRESEYENTKVLVKFKTVRFQEQPIPGIRIYFCEHITPNYVWQSHWLSHVNQITTLQKINITTHHIQDVTNQFVALLNIQTTNTILRKDISQIFLPNIELSIHQSPANNAQSKITSIYVSKGPKDIVDFEIDTNFFNSF